MNEVALYLIALGALCAVALISALDRKRLERKYDIRRHKI